MPNHRFVLSSELSKLALTIGSNGTNSALLEFFLSLWAGYVVGVCSGGRQYSKYRSGALKQCGHQDLIGGLLAMVDVFNTWMTK